MLPVLRLHVFHLLQTVGPNSIGLDVGVPARGLHGEAYRGHVFWDELFVFPVLNLSLPELSRSLMEYRYHRLPAARRAAAMAGHAGAMFPWQSGSDGTTTPWFTATRSPASSWTRLLFRARLRWRSMRRAWPAAESADRGFLG